MRNDLYEAARRFVYREGRLLERRLFAAALEGGPASAVVDALRGYQNEDGGFGQALEPDTRCPDSLPLDVEVAFQTLLAAGTFDAAMVRRACDFLDAVAGPDGAVPLAFPVIEQYPRAEHMTDWTYRPGLFPTAGLAGLLHRMAVVHPWVDRATAFCWSALAVALPDDAHAIGEVLVFLEHVPDRERAEALGAAVAEHLPKTTWYRADADDPSYGVTPLHLAPTPQSLWRRLFADQQIEAHLDRLALDQQEDGGWAITWEPPGTAATLEWRGVETVRALRVLRAYGRL